MLLTEKGEIHRRQPLVAGSTPVWCKLDAFHASKCTCNSVVRVRVLCCENLIFCFDNYYFHLFFVVDIVVNIQLIVL